MKRNIFIATLMFAVLSVTGPAHAQLQAMTDTEMAQITGQAGFATAGTYTALQRSFTAAGVSPFATSELSYQVQRTGTVSNIKVGADGKSYSFEIQNPGVSIRDFHTRIHAGSTPTPDNSLGSLSISHVRVTTHGTVRITVK